MHVDLKKAIHILIILQLSNKLNEYAQHCMKHRILEKLFYDLQSFQKPLVSLG